MKKIFFERYPIFRYIIGSYIKSFFVAAVLFGAAFAVLFFTGLYAKLESILDLKYDSPFVLVPLWAFVVLAVISLLVGCLMYFHQYKRNKSRSRFYRTFFNILNGVQVGGQED